MALTPLHFIDQCLEVAATLLGVQIEGLKAQGVWTNRFA